MSYYSDVKCVMYKKDFENVRKQINELQLTEDDGYRDIFWNKMTEINLPKTKVVVLDWEGFNHWDSCTNEVIEYFENYLQKMKEQNKPFKFIRVGEGAGIEYSDIEIDAYFGKDYEFAADIDIIEVETSIKIVGK